MKQFQLALVFSFIFLGNSAQRSLDLFTLAGYYGLPSKYEAPYENQKAKPLGAQVVATLPIPLNETTYWFNQITYNNFNIDNDITMPAGIANPIHLSAFIMQTGLYKKFGEGQGIQILFAPRYMTDFQNASGKNFQLGGIIMYEKDFHEGLLMRFGAMYHNELGGPLLVPIVHTDWQINSKWSLVGMWPIYGKFKYQVNDNISTGISHFGLVTSYRLGHPDYEGDYMERTSIDLSWFGRIRLTGNLHMEGRFGYALGREYKQYSADQKADFRIAILKFGDNRVAKNVLFEPGFVVNLRVVYNMPL
ncbi:DUF6268 family outer membrane beta-barrel protein [Bacteroidota bacterium]